jgi:hypothetical protein
MGLKDMRKTLRLAGAVVVVTLALLFCGYPALVVGVLLVDAKLRTEGQSCLAPMWFKALSGRYARWAERYLSSGFATHVSAYDVAATEWPMFGSVFFLLTADELQRQGQLDCRQGGLRRAVDLAAAVVVSPDTASWVRAKWGDAYLERENVFYRMLLIMGLSSYERITGDTRHRALMSAQRKGLAAALERAPLHVLDDYPGECWPNDVLWAVAAIKRAAALEGESHADLERRLMISLNGPLKVRGLPAYKVDKDSGVAYDGPRGCGNSGILCFAGELDPAAAARWYKTYEALFWKRNAWLGGFREWPAGTAEPWADVDSGPIAFVFGSVASAFGIGAAKASGRMDHAAVLTLEAVACSWPTPFCFVVPTAMGALAVGGGCLAETALLFAMTRPCCAATAVPFAGPVPLLVWVLFAAYGGACAALVVAEIRAWRRHVSGQAKGRAG